MDNISFTPEAKGFLKKFLQQRINESPLFSEMPFYYKKVLEMMEGAKRSMPQATFTTAQIAGSWEICIIVRCRIFITIQQIWRSVAA